jgi:photosystem II stability/assembly factor-like uncharacterized protein
MTFYERVIQILDDAIGGPNVNIGFHGAFWRGLTRNQFVAKKVFGLELISLGDGAGSNLVKALKGESPFGADLPNPPIDATFNRMPSGRDPVSPSDIAFIQKWIDEGCLEDSVPVSNELRWRKTNAPQASSRTDDIWFLNADTGWAVNSDGNILKTTDGGSSWSVQHSAPGVYLRCVGFANANVGWVGTLTRTRRLFHTTDGGNSWSVVSPLPASAQVAVCGLSVVNERVVYASGSNRPTDPPRMMKTTDGGQTWTAWDMAAHASILIDTFFTDELHGWVVGGKADILNPTTRDRIKPVVLQTSDGGVTWTNRLAGQAATFPFGEWGWKIQFLTTNVGFISLENLSIGAILKTTDGGASWTRLPVNDAQHNANLEGIGFIDEDRGWVGGWGSADFQKGFSSATTDSGKNWQDANEIGRFLNRFRFFGHPVSVGYASGDTVYKYSAEPISPAPIGLIAAGTGVRSLLPHVYITAGDTLIQIPMEIPSGTKRLTLHIWDRFGKEIGCVLDEIRPKAGARMYLWDGQDSHGNAVPVGDYILRLAADDAINSSILHRQASELASSRRTFMGLMRGPASGSVARDRRKTIASLMQDVEPPNRDFQWLEDALQIALQLELATLPPYLTARWTIKNLQDPVSKSIKEIRGEEMLHFGLACNLLVAIGGTPIIANHNVVPVYPGPLPGGVRPTLQVFLKRLSHEQAKVFMEIEFPQDGPIATFAVSPTYNSIGEFYSAILSTFQSLNPPLDLTRQIDGPIGLFKINTQEKVQEAIELINLQGEGSNMSPEERPGDLAHYYRFGEIYHEKRFVKDAVSGKWGFSGPDLVLPETWPMVDIPAGGYQQADVADPATWNLITTSDQQYSQMLRLLQSAWEHGDDQFLSDAVGEMIQMGSTGRQLIQKPKPDGSGNYGPCFRYVS